MEEQQQGSFSQMDTCLFWDVSSSLTGIRTTTEKRLFTSEASAQHTNADSLIRLILRHGSETVRLLLTVVVEKIRLEGKDVTLGNGSRSDFSPFSNFYAPPSHNPPVKSDS